MTGDPPDRLGERPFIAFGQWGPGRLDLRVFDQATWWVTVDGLAFRLESEMSRRYLLSVIAHLEANVEQFCADSLRRAAVQAARASSSVVSSRRTVRSCPLEPAEGVRALQGVGGALEASRSQRPADVAGLTEQLQQRGPVGAAGTGEVGHGSVSQRRFPRCSPVRWGRGAGGGAVPV